MSGPQTDFDAEYRWYDNVTKLNAEELTKRFLSMHQRMVVVELKGEGYDSLILQGIGAALQRINEGVTPLLVQLVAQVAEAQASFAEFQAKVAAGIDADLLNYDSPPGGLEAGNVEDALTELNDKLVANAAAAAAGSAAAITLAGTINARDTYLSSF